MRTAWIIPLAALAAGCNGKDSDTGVNEYCEGLTVASSANVATILEFSWTTPDADTATISWGKGDLANSFEDVVSDGTSHSAAILGVPSISSLTYEIVHASGEVCPGEVTTNNLPATVPSMEIGVYDAAQVSDKPYLAGVALGGQPAFFVIERESGDYLWYRELEGSPKLNPVMTFANGSNDILYNEFSEDRDNDIGAIYRESLTGESVEAYDTDWAHHTFEQGPDGVLAYVYADIREVTAEDTDDADLVGFTAVGDAIWLVDPATGAISELFSTWDYLPVQEGDLWDDGFYPQGNNWTHGNALNYYEVSPTTGGPTYLFSFGGLDVILEIDASSGEVVAEFSGDGGYGTDAAIRPAAGSTSFSFQHDTTWTDDGNLLMSSSLGVGPSYETYQIEYSVDYGGGALTEVWSNGVGEKFQAFALGQARRQDNGNTLISWGSGGLIREVTADNEVVWELGATAGNFFGHVELLGDIYTGE